MKKALSLIVLVFVVAGGAIQAAADAPALRKKPNVLFILIDDMGWKDLGCYGSDFYETPHIDALAESGVRFTDAYSASPLCSPTRASILTGQEPGRLRFTTAAGHRPDVVLDPQESTTANPYFPAAMPQSRTRLPNETITLAEVLRDQGYHTAFMGKWHLGHEPYIPENQGFDVVVGGRHHPAPPGPGKYFAPWNAETLPPVPEGTHICDMLTDEAIKYMESNREDPFLLCLWYYDVHSPFQSKEDLKQYYAAKLRPHHIQRSPTYAGMVATLDMNIGRVMQTLKDLGLEEETIVIFTSDNGGNMKVGTDGTIPTNNAPLRAAKGCNYEGGVRVPLMIRVPGMTKPGTTSDVVISTVDHFVSLTELLEIPFPEEQVNDGESYVRALKGDTYERGPLYSIFPHYGTSDGSYPSVSVRQGPWKLYKVFYDGEGQTHRYELYNLRQDIGETRNLVDEMPERVREMAALMETHIKEAGYLLPQKNRNFGGNVAAGWLGSKDTKVSVKDKILSVQSHGKEPWVETRYTPLVADATFAFEFEMKSNSEGTGSVSWRSGSTPYKPNHDGKWHSYRVEIPLAGGLGNLRILPSSAPGEIQLRNIRLETADGHYVRDWPLY